MRRVFGGLFVCAWLCAWGLAAPGQAQDDWGLTRERSPAPRPSKPRTARPRPGRAKEISAAQLQAQLEKRPNDGALWARLEHRVVSEAGELDAAVRQLQVQLAARPEQPVARALLAQLLTIQRRLPAAEAALAKAREELSSSVLALRHADLLTRLERPAEARQALLEVDAGGGTREQRAEALRSLAELDLQAGDVESARRRHEKLRTMSGQGAFAAAAFARALAAAGRHALAADEYAKLARQRSGDVRAAAALWRDATRQRLLADAPALAAEHARQGLRAARAGSPGIRRELLPLLIEAARLSGELAALAPELSRQAAGDPELTLVAASVFRDLGQPERAEALYRQVIRASPGHGEARLALAQLLSSTGQLEAAVAEYEALVRVAPDQPELVVELAELLVRLGRADRAREVVARAGRHHPRAPGLHRALAELYLRWEMRDRAQSELELLTRLEPDEPSHWIALGTVRLEGGDERGARRAWQQLLELGSDEADGQATLARVLADHDQLPEAIDHMERARALRAGDVQLERDYASMLERASRLREAETAWQRVLRSEQADAAARKEARQHLVVIWKRSGRLSRRIVSLEGRFDGTDPDLSAGRTLAEALSRSGPRERRRAAEVLERLVEADPDDLESLRSLAQVYVQLGRHDEALDVLERLVARDVGGAQQHLRRAVEVALEAYRDARALALAQRAVRMFPASAESHALLGELYLRQQQLQPAAESFRESLRLAPGQYGVAMSLAAVEMRRGRPEAAGDVYLTVLRGTRDDTMAARAAGALFQIHVASEQLPALERAVLPLALSRSDRPLYRRLLVDVYGAWLGPMARRVRSGEASAVEREQLAEVGRRAIRPLLEALADPDPAQREAALTLLGPMGHPGAVAALLALAEKGEGGQARAEAIVALALLRSPEATDGLVTLAKGPSVRLRPLAAWALGQVGGAVAGRALVELLEAPDPTVRAFAALALGHLGDRNAVAALRHAQGRAADPVPQAALLLGLAALQALPAPETLQAALAGPTPLGEAAALALAGQPQQLTSQLFQRPPALRRTIVRVLAVEPSAPLASLPVPPWPAEPVVYLDRLVQAALSSSVGTLELTRVVGPLVAPTTAALEEGGQAASAALRLLGGTEGPGALWELAHSSAACAAVPGVQGELLARLAEPLTEVWRTGERQQRRAALRLLARAGPGAADDVLSGVLREGRSAERAVVLRSLAGQSLEGPLRAAVLEVARRGEPWSQRHLAVTALGVPRTVDQLGAYERLLRDEPSAPVRARMVQQVSRASLPGQRALLNLAARDPEPGVAELALHGVNPGPSREPSGPARPADCLPSN